MMNYKTFAWMMAIAIASMTMTACSSDDNEMEKPFMTDPVEHTKFFACDVNSERAALRGGTATADTIFTEDDIEWFNVTTREIKFKDTPEPLWKKLSANHNGNGKLDFHLGENVLFEVSHFVLDIDSRPYFDLVLHYSMIGEDEGNPRYYLHDCYPSQIADLDEVKANREKNAAQWETFTNYLEIIGKLRK